MSGKMYLIENRGDRCIATSGTEWFSRKEQESVQEYLEYKCTLNIFTR